MRRALLAILFLLALPYAARAALTANALTNGGDSTCTNASLPVTASVTPTANALVFLWVVTEANSGTADQPTATGNGFTYDVVATALHSGNLLRGTLLRASGPSPTAGAITMGIASSTLNNCTWQVFEITGQDTSGTNGSGAIAQSKTAQAGSATSSSVTFDNAFFDANSASIGVTGLNNNSGLAVEAGFTEIGAQQVSFGSRTATEWKNPNGGDSSVTMTFTSNNYVAVAVEVKVAAAATRRKPAPRYYNSIYDPLLRFVNWLMELGTAEASAEFRNGFYLLGTAGFYTPPGCAAACAETKFVNYAKQWGYEWVLGDPWGISKSVAAVNAGLKVAFNLNANRGAKWYQIINPCGSTPGCDPSHPPSSPTQMSDGVTTSTITTAQYQEMEKTLCMTGAGVSMPTNQLYNTSTGLWKYRSYWDSQGTQKSSTVQFTTNFYTNQAVDLNVTAALRTRVAHEAGAGKTLYHGVYFDEANLQLPCEGGYAPNCSNPINSGVGANGSTCAAPADYDAYEAGRQRFMRGIRADFVSRLGSAFEGASGNVWEPKYFDPQQADSTVFLTLVHNESSGGSGCDTVAEVVVDNANGCGSANPANWGASGTRPAPANVQNQLTPTNTGGAPREVENSYQAASLIAGRSAWQGIWVGWFGSNVVVFSGGTIIGRGVQLARAFPMWDNALNVSLGSRTWNESTDTYTSPNSFSSPTMTYSRHRLYNTNHKLFLVRNSGTPSVTLNSNEKVVNAFCTDNYFTETTACNTSAYFTQSGNTVSLGGSVQNGAGYVLTVHRQPSFLSAAVPAADQLDVCFNTDDAPTAMIPSTNSSGWTVTVNSGAGDVDKTSAIQTKNRLGTNCYHLTFTASTITAATQTVKVAYSGGNITSGTDMINAGGKVTAASFTAQTAQNNLPPDVLPALSQTRYQWEHISGTPDDAVQYSSLSPSPGARARLRIKFRNTVNPSPPTSFPLYYAVDPADTTDPSLGSLLTDDCAANQVCYTVAIGVDDPTVSVERLTSDETTNVPCKVVQTATDVPTLTMAAATETECVYAIKFRDDLTSNQKVYFYPRGNGNTLLSGYTTGNLPHVTVVGPRSDKIGGTLEGGISQ